jgi:hypothetical protein
MSDDVPQTVPKEQYNLAVSLIKVHIYFLYVRVYKCVYKYSILYQYFI